jgi:LacI family transcriptional regulator
MSESPKHKRNARAATLADVGRLAGVSATAASAALNDTRTSARISEETRAKIVDAANKLGYRPNVAARALVNRRMNTIGVGVVFDCRELNHYFIEVFNGIIEAANHRGQNVTVFTFDDWFNDIGRVASVCDGRIDGMLLIGPTFSEESVNVLPTHTPFVSIPPTVRPRHRPVETATEERGALEITNHLIQLGHRRIMHISGTRGLTGPERRVRGYPRRSMRRASSATPTCSSAPGSPPKPRARRCATGWNATGRTAAAGHLLRQ